MSEPEDQLDAAGHLSAEQLDELARQASLDIDPDQAALGQPADSGLDAHLAGCASCRSALGDQIAVQAWLRRVPDVGAMPAELATRLDAAVRNASTARGSTLAMASGNVVPISRPARTGVLGRLAESRLTKSLVAATAVGLIALGGWAAIDHRTTSTDSAASGAGTSGGAPAKAESQGDRAAVTVRHSGTAYTPQNVIAEVGKQLVAAPSDAVGSGDSVASPLTSPTGLKACLGQLGDPAAVPLLVDLATYAGKPAAVIVLPSAGGQRVLWVVSPTCTTGDEGLLLYAALN